MRPELFALIMIATVIPPKPRPTPERIDISKRPFIELVTASGGKVLVGTSAEGQTIEMYSASGQEGFLIAFNWKGNREVETNITRGESVMKFSDTDRDGLPDVRRIYVRKDGQLRLVRSEVLHWTASPDEYDPSRTKVTNPERERP